MPSKHYHLAQINVGRTLGTLDSPVMAGFVAQLDHINALADASPGFVWRLRDATDVQAFDDPRILVNMSVWESIEALKEYAYRSGHREPLRDRLQWFERPKEAHLALWWTPAGHVPTVQEARERLEFRRAHGDTPVAFSFAKPFPEPEEPTSDPVPPDVSFDNRVFLAAANTPNGDCDAQTRFRYRQHGPRVWATYDGGQVRFGSVVAIPGRNGRLDMRYHHVDHSGRFRTGKCTATPEVLPDGRLRLHEEWQWTNGDLSVGRSVIEELAV
ncbi:MAG TPA: DUF3291 domain-containing protein [Bryobacteraceae bacterium]|nr:DUF3291 domain-containing protein [Bryobacteraceae bacterium]